MHSEDLILNQIVFCSRFFVTFQKLLSLGNEKKNEFSFCVSLTYS